MDRDALIDDESVARLREVLPAAADQTVTAITKEVPSYADALSGPMGETIRAAVRTALGGFVSLARSVEADPHTPTAQAVDGAYQLGRGEARSGRSVDALLSAYRIGARVSWQAMSGALVAADADAETLAGFAELVFAYIDELSAASLAGHTDELSTTGRVRQRLLERLARHLLAGAAREVIEEAAERAGWTPPRTLSAVLVPESQLRPVLAGLAAEPIELEDADGSVLLLVPDAHGRARGGLLRLLRDRGAVAGPARPWLQVQDSYTRATRVRELGLGPDSEEHLAALVGSADQAALADLRARVLAPLAELRPTAADKLTATLREWVLRHGRRDEVAAALFVHPQTVRYRMNQLRELYGDRLEDPQTIYELALALGPSTVDSVNPGHGEGSSPRP